METRSAKRKKLLHAQEQLRSQTHVEEEEEEEDRITDLPDAVLHHILLLLPIKSIAQTTLLSKRWKNLWYNFPDLDFSSVSSTTVEKSTHLRDLGNIITQVLSIRDKNSDLRSLKFKFRACFSFSGLQGVIRSAVRHNVQELDIKVTTNDYFNFPRSILTSDSIRVLRLKSHYPGFRLPPSRIMKSGFQKLHTLSLSIVILYQQPNLLDLFTPSSFPHLKILHLNTCFGLNHLIISCKGLEDLSLKRCFQLSILEICCPKLEKLKISSCFDAYGKNNSLKLNAPKLRIIHWDYNAALENCLIEGLKNLHDVYVGLLVLHENLTAERLNSLSKFLSGLSAAQCLKIDSQCVEMLSKRNYRARAFFRPFVNLKSLELHTNYIPALASLLRSSPILQTLVIKILGGEEYKGERKLLNRDLWTLSSSVEEKHWESQSEVLKPFLQYLKFVKIHGFMECEDDISLVKFLLKHGRVLQEMVLYSGHSHCCRGSLRRKKIRSQMMGFSCASSNARLTFH